MNNKTKLTKLIRSIIRPVLFPMIVVLIILFSNYLIKKDTFTFIKPKIQREYSDYLKVRDANTDLSLAELYNKFPEIPVYKLISIDIITTHPFSLQSTIPNTVSKYYSRTEKDDKDKETLINDVSNEINRLNKKDAELRNLMFTILFISLFSISL